jgi:hypothetical protein
MYSHGDQISLWKNRSKYSQTLFDKTNAQLLPWKKTLNFGCLFYFKNKQQKAKS